MRSSAASLGRHDRSTKLADLSIVEQKAIQKSREAVEAELPGWLCCKGTYITASCPSAVDKKFLASTFDNTSICTREIGGTQCMHCNGNILCRDTLPCPGMLLCFEQHDFEKPEKCEAEIETLYACMDLHSKDPVS